MYQFDWLLNRFEWTNWPHFQQIARYFCRHFYIEIDDIFNFFSFHFIDKRFFLIYSNLKQKKNLHPIDIISVGIEKKFT